ncbi:MAG: hypothetical protein HGJ94_00025 [Desulfosarcina sp.]|nr:hypothetical protein [Desulfosarcina sp.]
MDQGKIIIYGAIDGTDSNGNGVLDSEEGTDAADDFDDDGTPDYMDSDTATFRHPKGIEKVRFHTSNGNFSNVACISDDDPSLPQNGKPSRQFPYGVNRFLITGLSAGESVTVSIEFPDAVSTTAQYYKVNSSGQWREIIFGSNDGDNLITLILTDGDPLTDADGVENGIIEDPGALTTTTTTAASSSGGGGGCFITTLFK